jgi:O-methyltransferase
MKFAIIRLSKSIFIKLRLHVIFGPFSSFFLQLAWLSKLSKWAHENKAVKNNDFYSKWDYKKRFKLYQQVISDQNLHTAINYLEFGVADGESFDWWMTQNTDPASNFYGFDTFTGLPEDFGPYKKGTFNSGKIPSIKDSRGKFYQGLFQQTLPGFLKNFDNSSKTVVMLDADIFTATLFTLTSLAPYLKKDDIILFDEFVVPTHEFMAYQQFIDSYYFKMQLIGVANNYYFAAFKVV